MSLEVVVIHGLTDQFEVAFRDVPGVPKVVTDERGELLEAVVLPLELPLACPAVDFLDQKVPGVWLGWLADDAGRLRDEGVCQRIRSFGCNQYQGVSGA